MFSKYLKILKEQLMQATLGSVHAWKSGHTESEGLSF